MAELGTFTFGTAQLGSAKEIASVVPTNTIGTPKAGVPSTSQTAISTVTPASTTTVGGSTTTIQTSSGATTQSTAVAPTATPVTSTTGGGGSAVTTTATPTTPSVALDVTVLPTTAQATPTSPIVRTRKRVTSYGSVGLESGPSISLKEGSLSPWLQFELLGGNGSPIDLTSATAQLVLASPGGRATSEDVTVEDAENGIVTHAWSRTTTEAPGHYLAEIRVDFDGGTGDSFDANLTVPRTEYIEVEIDEGL